MRTHTRQLRQYPRAESRCWGRRIYDPKADAWREITPAHAIPAHESWFGWMKLCYDGHHDCFIGMIADRLYAFRDEPAR